MSEEGQIQYWDAKAQPQAGYACQNISQPPPPPGYQGTSQPPPPPGYQGTQPPPPPGYQGTSQPPPPPGYQGTSHPPPPPPPSGYYEHVQNTQQQSAAQRNNYSAKDMARLQKWMSIIPCMHMCPAWTCAIINFIIPGIGTIIAAFIVLCPCCSKHPSYKDRIRISCINFWIGLIQLITYILIIGAVWAYIWARLFIVFSYIGYHNTHGIEEIQEIVVGEPKQADKGK